MDPITAHQVPESWRASKPSGALPVTGAKTAEHPEAFALFERGAVEQRIVHDADAWNSGARSANARRSRSATPPTRRAPRTR